MVWLIVAVVVLLIGAVVYGRMTNSSLTDRLQRRDPEAAARIEQLRADQAIRGQGQTGGGPTTFGGSM